MSPSPAPEQELALLLCGTDERRRARAHEAEVLLQRGSDTELLALIERLNVVTLVGQRLLALGLRPTGSVIERIDHLTEISREHETLLEMMTLAILSSLERAGIRALPLKGSLLARELYGDPALRSSLDIDILVASQDLGGAAEVVRSMGWQDLDGASEQLPRLHRRMWHPALPRVELHWRVHWYEDRFAADALASATSPRVGAPLRMQPAEELASLLLFYARDGFSGLRMPADIAAWWSLHSGQLDRQTKVDDVAERYPTLAAPLCVGSALLETLVGVPGSSLEEAPLSWRAASVLANPFLLGGDPRILGTASLIDLVLAPPRRRLESIRRGLGRNPAGAADTRSRSLSSGRLTTGARAPRVLRRWASAAALALVRLSRSRPRRSGP